MRMKLVPGGITDIPALSPLLERLPRAGATLPAARHSATPRLRRAGPATGTGLLAAQARLAQEQRRADRVYLLLWVASWAGLAAAVLAH